MKSGETYYIMGVVSFKPAPIKIHIDYVLESKHYEDETLIVYSFYSKRKQWCTNMETEEMLQVLIDRAERIKAKGKIK